MYLNYRELGVTATDEPLPRTVGYLFMWYNDPGPSPGYPNPIHVIRYRYFTGPQYQVYWTPGNTSPVFDKWDVGSGPEQGSFRMEFMATDNLPIYW